MLDQHRNPRWWPEVKRADYRFAGWSTHEGPTSASADGAIAFEANDALAHRGETGYITIGKGHP